MTSSKTPSSDAVDLTARDATTSPLASTMVAASTQSRIVPYLKVAAPAALVETAPPAVAPRNVGTGGSHEPCAPSCRCSASNVTPAPTVTVEDAMRMP